MLAWIVCLIGRDRGVGWHRGICALGWYWAVHLVEAFAACQIGLVRWRGSQRRVAWYLLLCRIEGWVLQSAHGD